MFERIRIAIENWWKNYPPVTRNLIVINLIVLLLDRVVGLFGIQLSDWLGLVNWNWSAFHYLPQVVTIVGNTHYVSMASFHIWQPFTYMFMHANFTHWFCNMFAVFMFGPVVEHIWGSKKFLLYYIVCGLGAALVQELVWWPTAGNMLAVTVGASGAVFGLLLAFAWLCPEQKIFLLFIPIPIPARIFVGLYAAFELFVGGVSAMNYGHFAGDNVAHFAHLGGMLFGALLILFWKWQAKRKNPFKTYRDTDFSR